MPCDSFENGLGAGLQHHFFDSLSRGADLETQCQWQAGASSPNNSQQLPIEMFRIDNWLRVSGWTHGLNICNEQVVFLRWELDVEHVGFCYCGRTLAMSDTNPTNRISDYQCSPIPVDLAWKHLNIEDPAAQPKASEQSEPVPTSALFHLASISFDMFWLY